MLNKNIDQTLLSIACHKRQIPSERKRKYPMEEKKNQCGSMTRPKSGRTNIPNPKGKNPISNQAITKEKILFRYFNRKYTAIADKMKSTLLHKKMSSLTGSMLQIGTTPRPDINFTTYHPVNWPND